MVLTRDRPLIRDRAILAMMGGQTLIWAALFYSFVGLVPFWQDDLGWSVARLMAGLSLAAVIWALATPAAGRAIDRGWGPWLMPVAGMAGAGLLAALAWVDSYGAFVAIWVAMGLCMAATLYEPAFAMVLRARGPGARRAITAIALVAGFASAISYPLVYNVATGFGWRNAALVMAGVAALLAVPMLALAARWLEAEATQAAPPTPRARRDWRGLLALPGFALMALGFALAAFVPGMLLPHLFPLMAARGIEGTMAVVAASLIGPAQVAGRILVVLAGPSVPAVTITLAAMLMLALAPVLMAGAALIPALVFGYVLAHGTGNGLVGIFRPMVARDCFGAADIGTVAGALAAPALFLAALAPFIGAMLVGWGGDGLMLGVAGGAGLLGAACLFWATRGGP